MLFFKSGTINIFDWRGDAVIAEQVKGVSIQSLYIDRFKPSVFPLPSDKYVNCRL